MVPDVFEKEPALRRPVTRKEAPNEKRVIVHVNKNMLDAGEDPVGEMIDLGFDVDVTHNDGRVVEMVVSKHEYDTEIRAKSLGESNERRNPKRTSSKGASDSGMIEELDREPIRGKELLPDFEASEE